MVLKGNQPSKILTVIDENLINLLSSVKFKSILDAHCELMYPNPSAPTGQSKPLIFLLISD